MRTESTQNRRCVSIIINASNGPQHMAVAIFSAAPFRGFGSLGRNASLCHSDAREPTDHGYLLTGEFVAIANSEIEKLRHWSLLPSRYSPTDVNALIHVCEDPFPGPDKNHVAARKAADFEAD
jgi:hypothetical protein